MTSHLCPAASKNTLEMVQYGVEGSSTFLECQARSPHAVIKWHLQRDNSDRRKEVGLPRTGSPCLAKRSPTSYFVTFCVLFATGHLRDTANMWKKGCRV